MVCMFPCFIALTGQLGLELGFRFVLQCLEILLLALAEEMIDQLIL